MNIIILEDELNSADRLKRMLGALGDQYRIVGTMTSNAETKAFFANTDERIDLILSDIQLGDGLSFESLRSISGDIPVIFTTAYDHYALQAFKFNSIDYLLKPIEKEELKNALDNVARLHPETTASTTDAIAQLLASINSSSIHYRERFLIPHHSDEFLIVPTTEVSHITIKDGVVRLCTKSGTSHALNLTLDEVESQLDPKRFLRVNRQYIISATAVEKLSTYFLGKIRIHMTGYPAEEIIVSREKVTSVKKWLDS